MASEAATEQSGENTESGSNGQAALGARIRAVRARRGQSLAELAAHAGVSRSLISQIERGIASPSIDTVRKLASALEVPVFSLFLDGLDNDTIVRANRRRTVSYPGSKVKREILSPGVHGRMVLLWVTFPPGEQSGVRPVHHTGEECVVVIHGRLEVLMGEEGISLDTGDSMTFDSELPHVFRNPTDEVTELIVAITPPNI